MGRAAEIWDQGQARSWILNRRRFDAMLGPLGLAAIDALQLRGGETALDVGCGTGDPPFATRGRPLAGGGLVGDGPSRRPWRSDTRRAGGAT